jgi:ribonuclease HI
MEMKSGANAESMAEGSMNWNAKVEKSVAASEVSERPNVRAHTDGCCLGNPGPGGLGVVLEQGDRRKEISEGFAHTTNNRMELLAAVRALESLKQPCKVVLHSDSKYVVDGISKGWARSWRAKNWRKSSGGFAVNPDLWGRLLDLCAQHQVEFRWVKGHAGDVENERCDVLAKAAAQLKDLPADPGYP